MNLSRLHAALALCALWVVVCGGATEAFALSDAGAPASYASLVDAGVFCGLPEHQPTTASLVEDERNSAPAPLPCHRGILLANCNHDCCKIKAGSGVASGSFPGFDGEEPTSQRFVFPLATGGVTSSVSLTRTRSDAPDAPPPTLL